MKPALTAICGSKIAMWSSGAVQHGNPQSIMVAVDRQAVAVDRGNGVTFSLGLVLHFSSAAHASVLASISVLTLLTAFHLISMPPCERALAVPCWW